MTNRKVLQQALEALEAAEFHAKRRVPDASIEVAVRPAIEALREALAQQDFFKELAGQSMLSLWANYCDKKMQVDELQAKLDALAQQGEQQPEPDEAGHIGFQEWWDSVADEYEVTDFKKMRRAWNASLEYAPAAQPTWREELLVKEMRYIAGISTGQVQRVAERALEKVKDAPEAQPLTDEQIEGMHEEQDFIATLFQVKRIVRATELAHGIGVDK